jgi:hypothetical protein
MSFKRYVQPLIKSAIASQERMNQPLLRGL